MASDVERGGRRRRAVRRNRDAQRRKRQGRNRRVAVRAKHAQFSTIVNRVGAPVPRRAATGKLNVVRDAFDGANRDQQLFAVCFGLRQQRPKRLQRQRDDRQPGREAPAGQRPSRSLLWEVLSPAVRMNFIASSRDMDTGTANSRGRNIV